MPRHQPRERSAYQQKLLDPRWQKKRLEVFERDEWTCQACHDKEATLHVHHRYYEQGCEPWEYPLDAFITYCAECHELETFYKPLAEQALLMALRKQGFGFYETYLLAKGFEECAVFPITKANRLAFIIRWALEREASTRTMSR